MCCMLHRAGVAQWAVLGVGFHSLSPECFLLLWQVFKPRNFVTNKIIQSCNLLYNSDVVSHIKSGRYCSLFCDKVKANVNYRWAFCSVEKVKEPIICTLFFFHLSCALSKIKTHQILQCDKSKTKCYTELHFRILKTVIYALDHL